MIRFWIEFDGPAIPGYCGVTAYDIADAYRIIGSRWYGGALPPAARIIRESVDVSSLASVGPGTHGATHLEGRVVSHLWH